MKVRFLSATMVAIAMTSLAWADTTIVDENFDSYADQDAFEAVWSPDLGNGTSPTDGPKGILVPEFDMGLAPPNDDPPGIQGKGVNILDNINEYNGPNVGAMANLVPTDSESIRLTGDIFDDIAGNKRTTIGLRNDTVPLSFGVWASNIIEMGFYNADTFDPFDPAPTPPSDIPSTGYAYRMALYGARGDGLVHEPNWQYFQLDPVLDIKGAEGEGEDPIPDGLVTPLDIGQGWHRYSTIITPTSITFTLDLFRDGKANTEATEGVGPDGVDASVTWDIAPANNATEPNPFDPFTSLRFGGASGISGNRESVVDNILLELIDVASGENADFDGDGDIDGNDFLTWQRGNGIDDGTAQLGDGDANADGNVDAADLGIWQGQFGSAATVSAVSAVPEPASIGLVLLAMAGLAMVRKR